MRPGEPLAEVTRRDVVSGREVVESVHSGHLAVVDGDGAVVAAVGDADQVVYVRSAAKPFQATACRRLLGADAATLGDAEVAVAWASHRGEPAQLDAVGRLLERSGTPPEQLTCPPAVPEADPAAKPGRLLHNCSGKHALFALAGRRLGVTGPELLDPEGPLQQRILAELADWLGPASAVGVDGCGAPAVAVPLVRLAHAYARLVDAPDAAAVREAGLRHPGLVGGDGRLESALLAAGVLAKPGAEGVYGIGWSGRDGRPRGMAVKAADGNARGASAAAIRVLLDLGVVAEGTWSPPPPLGGGRPAGVVRAAAPVRALAAGTTETGRQRLVP